MIPVIPAKAGIQKKPHKENPGFLLEFIPCFVTGQE
jgi:hypothetical protein